MKKTLVTGATGLLGAHLLLYLLQGGKRVRALKRKNSRFDGIHRLFDLYQPEQSQLLLHQVEWVEADLLDPFALDEALKGVSEVYHAAGMVDFDRKKEKELIKVNVEGTATLVNASIEAGIDRFCHISSIAALDKGEDSKEVTEEAHFQKRKDASVYAWSKHLGEMEVWRAAQEGLKAVVVYPGVVLASAFWEQSSGKIFREVQKKGYFYTKGSSAYVDARDLAQCCIGFMKDEFMNQSYIVIDENKSYKEIITKIRRDLGCTSPLPISNRGLRVFSALTRLCSFFSRRSNPLSGDMVKSLSSSSCYSNQKTRKTLGYQFRGVDSSLEEHLKNYKKEFSCK